jgi:hypothetical protein
MFVEAAVCRTSTRIVVDSDATVISVIEGGLFVSRTAEPCVR